MAVNESLWRWFCAAADRARVRKVPPPSLASDRRSPLAEDLWLDPRCLHDPEYLYPAPPPVHPDVWETVDEADGVEVERLSFISPAPLGMPVNDRVVVRFYRPARRRALATLVVLHGIWRQDDEFEDRLSRSLAQHAVAAAVVALPFHWERAPLGTPSGGYFLSHDPLWGSATFRQAVIDARAVLGLFRGRGVPIGVLGFSLGGILAHMLMAMEPLDFGGSAFAGGETAAIVWEGLLTRSYRRAMEGHGVTFERLARLWATGDPTRYATRRRPARMLMLNALYDLCVPLRCTLGLWRALGEPPIRWLPAGHVTGFLFRRTIVREVLIALGLPPPVPAPSRLRVRRELPGIRQIGFAA